MKYPLEKYSSSKKIEAATNILNPKKAALKARKSEMANRMKKGKQSLERARGHGGDNLGETMYLQGNERNRP